MKKSKLVLLTLVTTLGLSSESKAQQVDTVSHHHASPVPWYYFWRSSPKATPAPVKRAPVKESSVPVKRNGFGSHGTTKSSNS